MGDALEPGSLRTSLAPWLSVPDSGKALEFYRAAFDAQPVFLLEGGVVARLSIAGAEFWISHQPEESETARGGTEGGPVRLILTVTDPDVLFAQACRAGAVEVYPVREEHGWRLGRLVDPFGLHWEIGRPLDL